MSMVNLIWRDIGQMYQSTWGSTMCVLLAKLNDKLDVGKAFALDIHQLMIGFSLVTCMIGC